MTIARFERVADAQYRQDAASLPGAMALADIPLPRRATAGSAGYDFTCPAEVTLAPGQSVTIPTGMRALMEPGWVLLLFPRSSLGFRYGLRLSNTVGVIDGDYAQAANGGHILVRLRGDGDRPVTLAAGDRFCQGVFVPFGLCEEDDRAAADRRGGLGSTGR